MLMYSVVSLDEKIFVFEAYGSNSDDGDMFSGSDPNPIRTYLTCFYPTTATAIFPGSCEIMEWVIILQGDADVNAIHSFNWKPFQQNLLKLDHVPVLVFQTSNIKVVRDILGAVVQDSVLAQFPAQKMEVRLGRHFPGQGSRYPPRELKIPMTSSSYTIDGSSVTLNPMQHFEYLIREESRMWGPKDRRRAYLSDPQRPEEYLRNILAQTATSRDTLNVGTCSLLSINSGPCTDFAIGRNIQAISGPPTIMTWKTLEETRSRSPKQLCTFFAPKYRCKIQRMVYLYITDVPID